MHVLSTALYEKYNIAIAKFQQVWDLDNSEFYS